MSHAICDECAGNFYLKEMIASEGVPLFCSVCDTDKARAFNTEELANILSPIIRENYVLGGEQWMYYSQGFTELHGDNLEYVISGILYQDLEFIEELVAAVVATDEYCAQDGDEPFFDETFLYARKNHRVPIEHYFDQWNGLLYELKHKRRFYSESVKKFFDGLFAQVENLNCWRKDVEAFESVVSEKAHGMLLYRGRIVESDAVGQVVAAPYQQVGPPPQNKSKAGRMNPEGIVVLYCAMERDTAISELRPAIGGSAAVITLATTRKIRLLHFERLERTFEMHMDLLQPDLQEKREERRFLQKLHTLISQPVVPGREADYLITQAMAEYLAHVYTPSLDGVSFKSTQCEGGVNVVLFSNNQGEVMLDNTVEKFPVEYVQESIKFFRTSGVHYDHVDLHSVDLGEGVQLYSTNEMMGEH